MRRRDFIKTVLGAMAAAAIPIPLSGMAPTYDRRFDVIPYGPMVKVPVETIEATQKWMRQMEADNARMMTPTPTIPKASAKRFLRHVQRSGPFTIKTGER